MTRTTAAKFVFAIAAAMVSAGGCAPAPTDQQVNQPSTKPQAADSPVDADSVNNANNANDSLVKAEEVTESNTASAEWRDDVTLTLKTWSETQSLIKEHQGRVVVVDVWSTACEPCLREFPHLVELQNALPEDVVCIGVNCDYAGVRRKPPEYYRERVTRILEDKKAHIINVMCTQPADELFTELKIDSIPAVFVYDREGNLAATFDNRTNESAEFTYETDVMPVIKQLVHGIAETAATPGTATTSNP